MLSVEDARARILSGLRPTAPEIVGLAEAWHRVSSTPLLARLDQPPRDVSAMDGYALAAEAGGTWRVVGSAPAGHPWSGRLAAGEAVRLFTGSIMPEGARTVLLQEDADVADDAVRPVSAVAAGKHIRRAGQDFARGDVLIEAGRRLSARDVGLAASGNHPWITVHRRPRVAILATGDEIALPGESIPDGGIVSSNAHALAALVRDAGGEPGILPIAGDDLAALALAADAAAGFDLLLTTGGASVGDHDLVQAGLSARGMALSFWKVAMRPGKPMMHGWLGGLPVIGLPGNPVSCFVTAMLFAQPAIRRLGGERATEPRAVQAVLGRDVPANDLRADHLRAAVDIREDGVRVATPFDRQDSAQMRLLAKAGCLILRPPHAPAVASGATVPVLMLEQAL